MHDRRMPPDQTMDHPTSKRQPQFRARQQLVCYRRIVSNPQRVQHVGRPQRVGQRAVDRFLLDARKSYTTVVVTRAKRKLRVDICSGVVCSMDNINCGSIFVNVVYSNHIRSSIGCKRCRRDRCSKPVSSITIDVSEHGLV